MTPQSRRFVIDNVPPEALPSELAAFLNIPLETADTKLEMAMDMRTGMCKGVAFVTLPHSKSNNLMWSNGRSFLGHRVSIQLDDPFPFEKQSDDSGFGSAARNTRSSASKFGGGSGMGGGSGGLGFDIDAANDMIPGLGDSMRAMGNASGIGGGMGGGHSQSNGGGPMRRQQNFGAGSDRGAGRGMFGGRGRGGRGGRGAGGRGRGGRGAPYGGRPQIGGKTAGSFKPEARYNTL